VRFVIVTHCGPCAPTDQLHDEIMERKKRDRDFAHQILYSQKFPEGIKLNVLEGDIPVVGSMSRFEDEFILNDPPRRRLML